MYSRRNHQDPKHTHAFRRERNADHKRQYDQHYFFAAKNAARTAAVIERDIQADELSLPLKISLVSAVLLMTSAFVMSPRANSHFKAKPLVGTSTDDNAQAMTGKRYGMR